MARTALLACVVLIAAALPGRAQDARMSPDNSTANGGAGIRAGNITSTGATVPNPGVSQGAGTTSMDRGIQQRDNQVDSSICKGC